jgi:SAM-dependent methyltransferase
MIRRVPPTRSARDVLDETLPAAEPLARARAREPVADERYMEGGADALPLEDGSADVVVFANSLHHVPGELLDAALAEAARVLRPGGLLYVQEPVAEGPYFELVRAVDDETAVRAAAHAAIGRAAEHGLRHEREERFDSDVVHPDFASFRDRVVLADAARTAVFAEVEDDLRAQFEASAERTDDGGYRFRHPMRVDVLRRA